MPTSHTELPTRGWCAPKRLIAMPSSTSGRFSNVLTLRQSVRVTTAATVVLSALACRTRSMPREDPPSIQPPEASRELPAQDRSARRPFRDRNAIDADIARGPVPGYAGVMIEGGCTFVVFLTDTLKQKSAALAYFPLQLERQRPSAHSNCGGPYRLAFRQVKYDFAQLYSWYVGPFRSVWRDHGLVSTDIDEARNQLAVGVEDSAAYRRMLDLVETLNLPKGVVRIDVTGRVCVGTGGPSVMVEVRDPNDRPGAIGTTIVIQDGAFKDSVDGSHAVSELHVGAGERRPGRYEVRLYKPGYKPVFLHNVMAPGDEQCHYAEPTDVRKIRLERASTFEELAAPSWSIIARREGKVLLAAKRVIMRGIVMRRDDPRQRAHLERAREYPTLIFENGRVRDGPLAHYDPRILGETARRDTLRLYSLGFQGRRVFFAQTGDAPAPNESPTEAGLYVIEHNDRLWLLADSGVSRLTADTVRGIARDTLRLKTKEMGPHLFWAASPVWSPDGSAIAYVTNRTWMLARGSNQEVWLAELRPRRERPLLSERGGVFSPVGWLGSQVVYTAREAGIFAVEVGTSSRRKIAPGSAAAFSPLGSRLLYMTPLGDTAVRGHVLTERGVVAVPDPPLGEHFEYGGRFSPSGNRLVLGTTFARDSGVTRAIYVFDLATKQLTVLMQWSSRESGRHPLGLPGWLDESTLLLTQFDRATGLESSTMMRLPPR